ASRDDIVDMKVPPLKNDEVLEHAQSDTTHERSEAMRFGIQEGEVALTNVWQIVWSSLRPRKRKQTLPWRWGESNEITPLRCFTLRFLFFFAVGMGEPPLSQQVLRASKKLRCTLCCIGCFLLGTFASRFFTFGLLDTLLDRGSRYGWR